MGKSKKVGLYARVSTDGQTTENQLLDLRRVAELRGWNVVETYTDHGISGSKRREQRPAFDRMVRDAAMGKLDLIAAAALDRVGRNGRDVVNFMADLQDQGVSLYLHREQLDSSTAQGKLVLTIMAAVNEMELASLKDRIRAGLRRARAQGKRLGRPTSVTTATEARIRALAAKGVGKIKIGRTLGCGTSTVQRVLAAA